MRTCVRPQRARLVVEPRDIARAVAHHRQRFLGQRGDDQFAGFAGRHRLERLRVDHLEQEMILPAVQAVLRHVAFGGHARPDDLGQAVEIDRLDARAALRDRGASRRSTARRRRCRAAAAACGCRRPSFGDLGDVERVGRRRAEHVRAEVLQQRHLPLGHAAGDRHDGAAEPLGAVVHAEPAGEQAVAIGVVQRCRPAARPRRRCSAPSGRSRCRGRAAV